ncbi:outer membrane protein assembly factor BamD [Marinimicrobium sp. ABcell2]|uniref:outer membrane protein assembly factor BamD n=1 Tax=Marinimicrobium sp. ABcell2 TaxID=3069751 RepID=UPI0027B39637|nr:outer membrane protein assembly factor BamD [Marinimicrobium sp. ABcell2]MDQ2078116.1 outer membrane protein assembly factor BamD [Marinimicrobium sp. ABcell2]
MQALRFLLIGGLILLTACSTTDRDEYISEADLYQAAQEQLERGQWEPAIRNLRNLEEHFPFGTHAEQAQLELIYAYHRSNQPDLVAATADRFIRLHPQHRNVDYAYYMKGLSSFTEGRGMFERVLPTDLTQRDPGAARESLAHFSQLLARFPDSEYAPDAKKRMLYLRNLLARYEIHVANYYFKRGAYLAATNRGRFVVENFNQTPAVPDALAVMVQGYQLLEMPELRDQTLELLRLNYPEHPALRRNGEFNFQYHSDSGDRSWLSLATFGLFDKRDPPGFDSRELYDPEYR